MPSPAVIGAGVSSAASLAGSALDYKAQKKISKELAKQAKAREALIIKYGQRQVDSLDGGYNAAKDTTETAVNRNLSLTGQTLKPMIEVGQAGDNLSQQMLNAGVTNSRAARRGDAVDNSLYTPQNVAVDYNALTGLTNPEPVKYAGFEQPDYENTAGAVELAKDAALEAAGQIDKTLSANEDSSKLGAALAGTAGLVGAGFLVPTLISAIGTPGGIPAAVAGLGTSAKASIGKILTGKGIGGAATSLLTNPLTWGAGALLLAVKNDFWKDPDGYVRSNSGLLVGPTPAAEGSDRAFAIKPFESGFQGTGFNRRGSQEDANKIIDVFREADSLITKAARNAGGNIDLSKATLNGVNEDGQYGTSGTFLGVGGKTSNLDLQVDFYAQQLANTITGLDADVLKELKSAETSVEIVNILENITANDTQSQTKQGASFSTAQVRDALNSGVIA